MFVFRHEEIKTFLALDTAEQFAFVADEMPHWGTGIEVAELYRKVFRVMNKYLRVRHEMSSIVKPALDDPDLLPWRGNDTLRQVFDVWAREWPPVAPSRQRAGKFEQLSEALERKGAIADLNEHHPKYVWGKFWPKLVDKVVNEKLPEKWVQSLSVKTCVSLEVVRAEVVCIFL